MYLWMCSLYVQLRARVHVPAGLPVLGLPQGLVLEDPASTMQLAGCSALMVASYALAIGSTVYAWRRGLASLDGGLE